MEYNNYFDKLLCSPQESLFLLGSGAANCDLTMTGPERTIVDSENSAGREQRMGRRRKTLHFMDSPCERYPKVREKPIISNLFQHFDTWHELCVRSEMIV